MKITSFGSSSQGNSILINNEILLDCGINPKEILIHTDFKLPLGILLTHSHKDHSKYAKDWTKRGVPVYSSQGELSIIGTGHYYKPCKALETFSIGKYQVTPIKAIHDTPEPLNFIVDIGDERLLYSTDTKGNYYDIEGITHLITECNFHLPILQKNIERGGVNKALGMRIFETHKSLDMLLWELEKMDKTRLQKIYLSHLSDNNSDEELFKQEVQKATGCEVYILDK